ncbi:MAG: transposase [Phycisphaerae bacterium]|nr:transposase [Phycisphaerae bacterium]
MTYSNQSALVFSNLGRKKIQADFTGGKLTSDAGAALLREVDRRIGLIDALADCITDPRQLALRGQRAKPVYGTHRTRPTQPRFRTELRGSERARRGVVERTKTPHLANGITRPAPLERPLPYLPAQ